MAEHVRIKRTFAEWMEDAICVTVPDGATVTDDDLHDQVEQLYLVATNRLDPATFDLETDAGTVTVGVELEWEDEHRTAVELDDEWTIEERWSDPVPVDPWDEVAEHPLDDWRYEVVNNDTRLGYVEWVQHRRDAALP